MGNPKIRISLAKREQKGFFELQIHNLFFFKWDSRVKKTLPTGQILTVARSWWIALPVDLQQIPHSNVHLGNRIKDLRKQKNLSQSELADKVGISYAQIGRYETKGAQPPAETLKKIADTLGVTPDFLIYGTSGEKAKTKLKDADLIQQFQAIESMDEEDKNVVKKLIDAFITKKQLQKMMQ